MAYVFVVKIFIGIWNRHTYLMPGFVGLLAGVLIYGGTKQWERWRIVLNSFYYLKLCNLPELSSVALIGYSNGSIVMGCVAFAIGVGLIIWQRTLDREERTDIVALTN